MAARGHTWVLIYEDPAMRHEAMRQLGRWAADPDLPFTWIDGSQMAAEMAKKPQYQLQIRLH